MITERGGPLAQNKTIKQVRPNWRHYDFTTAGPVDDYLYSMLPKRDEVLAEMEEYAGKHDVPIVGPAVARVLQQLALMIKARSVFELGSAIGYSTIWWAQAVGDTGRVIYTDGDAKNAEHARGYFHRAGVSGTNHAVHRRCAGGSFGAKGKNSISSSMTSIRKTIRACCDWYHHTCGKAGYSLPTMFCGADG